MQTDIFDLIYEDFKINKPIRLIELFAGYGSQALALKYLGVAFERWRICEFDKYAIETYNAFHNTNFKTSDITKIRGKDLNIEEKEKYIYMMTYSFPCTDLSQAGKRLGMEKGSNTRSGLLWEVERLLQELGDDLPQILVMENVPEVIKARGWFEWNSFLESLGYKNYCEILNAKDYYIPQNRQRAFMVSILGDYNFKFPKKMFLKYRVEDFLLYEVDEKYYLNEKFIDYVLADKENYQGGKKIVNKTIASTITTREGHTRCGLSNYIVEGLPDDYEFKTNKLILAGNLKNIKFEHNSRIYDSNGLSPTLTTNCGGNFEPKFKILNKWRKITPQESFRLMGVLDKDIEKTKVSNAQQYKQAGNSIVVSVLMAIFGALLDLDYETIIKKIYDKERI